MITHVFIELDKGCLTSTGLYIDNCFNFNRAYKAHLVSTQDTNTFIK